MPLLRTQITIPPTRLRLIERARLDERIKEGIRRALTLIVAPAGYGKTTLIAAWAQKAEIPVAWLSLQPGEYPRERFLSYLILALQRILPDLGQTALTLLQASALDGALYSLTNDLAEVESDLMLMIDDYHNADSQENGAVLQFLLENRPASFHLALISRSSPLISLTRLRALDQVCEIGPAELRFTAAETQVFFEYCMGVQLDNEALERLYRSSEGWAVGLQLAALTIARQPLPQTFPSGQEGIFDYLASEVLAREPKVVQDFIIKTALFERFSAALCDYLLGSELAESAQTAQNLLQTIERANLFLFAVEPTRTWFRYHALFSSFLRRQIPIEQARSYLQKASRWFEEQDLWEDAIHCALYGQDFDHAAWLVERQYRLLLQRGDQATLFEYLALIPASLYDRHPRLWLARGWANIITLNAAEAELCARNAESLKETSADPDKIGVEANSLRILAEIFAGKVAAPENFSATALLAVETDDFLHCILHFNLGLRRVMQGETGLAIEAFSETLRLSKNLGNALVSIVAEVQQGEMRQMRGALGLAERSFQHVIRYTKETLGEHSFLLGMPYVSYSDLLREQNRLEEARQFGEQGVNYCLTWQPVASMDGQIALARVNAAQRRWDEAFSRLDQAMQVSEASVSVIDDFFVAVHRVRLCLMRNELAEAWRLIRLHELDHKPVKQYYYLREITQLLLFRARVFSLEGDLTAAASIAEELTPWIEETQRLERITSLIDALLLQAYAYHSAARHAEAARNLTRALTLGAQSGYVRLFADEGKRLLQLLEQYRAGIAAPRAYLSQIEEILRQEEGLSPTAVKRAAHAQSSRQRLIPLTRRELDILRLIASGKSNLEIAAECVLTLNTVKKHVANILEKLGVANRTQAAMLAKKLGWLE